MVLVGLTGVFGRLPLEIVLQIHKPLIFRNLEHVFTLVVQFSEDASLRSGFAVDDPQHVQDCGRIAPLRHACGCSCFGGTGTFYLWRSQ